MDKKLIGATVSAAALVGVVSVGTAAAAVMNPTSYAELLQPIPNAVELLKTVDATPPVKTAQVFFGFGHHHHHNWHHHHHNWHHHHHNWHHHHHHHHWGYHHHHH